MFIHSQILCPFIVLPTPNAPHATFRFSPILALPLFTQKLLCTSSSTPIHIQISYILLECLAYGENQSPDILLFHKSYLDWVPVPESWPSLATSVLLHHVIGLCMAPHPIPGLVPPPPPVLWPTIRFLSLCTLPAFTSQTLWVSSNIPIHTQTSQVLLQSLICWEPLFQYLFFHMSLHLVPKPGVITSSYVSANI